MMALEMRQYFRIECDHCGRKADSSAPSAREARDSAMEEGFRIADWLDGECPRQTCFCPQCVEKFIREQIRVSSDSPAMIVKPVQFRMGGE